MSSKRNFKPQRGNVPEDVSQQAGQRLKTTSFDLSEALIARLKATAFWRNETMVSIVKEGIEHALEKREQEYGGEYPRP